MLALTLLAVLLVLVFACYKSRRHSVYHMDNKTVTDFMVLLNKERQSVKPDHTIYRYLWWDMPDNYELVNRLVGRGYWRDGFDFTNGRDRIWLECTPAMGWTAYRMDKCGKRDSLWLPSKFPHQFSALIR